MPASRLSVHPAALFLGLPLAMSLAITPAPAQSLGEVARKAGAARAGSPSKVYTNESLAPVADTPVAAPVAAQGSAAGQGTSAATQAATTAPDEAKQGAPASAGAADAKEKPEAKGEKYWRQRIQAERDALARAQSFAEALQSRINALSTDFVNRDDPAQRNVIAADRQKALVELERVRKEIAQHTQAIADIQQEARRAGVPAGWVR